MRPAAAARWRTNPVANEGLLPPERAFLLQLTNDTTPSGDAFAGRLEHLSSGMRRRFTTRENFLDAVAQLLRRRG